MERYIAERDVSVMSVETLLKKWQINRIDALVVDAEGLDWQIVKQAIDLGMKPAVIVFEYTHLSPAEREAALMVVGSQYAIEKFPRDYVCIRTDSR